ncbi:MAG TPA: replicative DNA helicase [Candidatus Coprenecus stercoravium]|uniref:Replicative DNA helicase n=1 Tax=Candidatus Coprenecus stercoravium TaxID=2840735 RepID=A0A9D2GS11_9BACT|nr:replicative DNA helicase [Candidatus Coprenecus stercoravium]
MAKTTRTKNKEVSIEAIGIEAGKVPPQAIDVEEAVIGALLIEPNAVPEVLDSLTADCFYKDAHRKIFSAISKLSSAHDPVDIYTVADQLKKDGQLEEIGGAYYLSLLSSKVGAAAHVDYHVKILLQKYIQRELISISAEMQRDSFDDGIPADDLLDNAQQKLFTLAERNMKRETQPIQDVIKEAVMDIEANQDRTDGLSGVPSGYTGIDRVTLGWQASDLVIIAARPAMGKTAFVLTMARNMAVDHKIPVAFFSLEMSSKQLVKRLLVSETGLSSEKIRGGKRLYDYEMIQLHERIKDLASAPLYIDDTPSLSIYELRSKARRLVRTAGVKLIIVDYLQLMTGPPELRGMREQEVSNISRSLKAIAKELDIPVIALSQLSRAVETRGGNKRPQLSDLRESGAIEQDADIVMFIHRPEYYGMESETAEQGLAEIIIAKHRNGSTADVPMRFRASEARFVDANEGGFGDFDPSSDEYMVESSMNNSEFESAD